MQSILIVGSIEKTRTEAEKLCVLEKISRFDKETIQAEKAVGIGEIRKLQEKVFLEPIESQSKAIILEAFFGITPEAQNAFLKVLEEPPANTIILVLVTALDFILPTILSRCNLINLEKLEALTGEEVNDNLVLVAELKKGGVGKALKLAQDNGKDREQTLQFLQQMLVSVDSSLGKNNHSDKELLPILKGLQKTYTIIKTTNVNPRFALENLFLNF